MPKGPATSGSEDYGSAIRETRAGDTVCGLLAARQSISDKLVQNGGECAGYRMLLVDVDYDRAELFDRGAWIGG